MSVVTKSGTNQFHGALWEFLRNKDMDARGYFESTLPPLKQNQYGASVGGPVWIPKVYNGKNRTFFYAAWEGFRIRSAVTTGHACTDGCDAQRRFQRAGRTDLRSGDDHLNPATGTVHAHRVPWQHYPRQPDQPDLGAFPDTHPAAGPLVNGNNVYSSGPARPTKIREQFVAIRISATITSSCFATAISTKRWRTRRTSSG